MLSTLDGLLAAGILLALGCFQPDTILAALDAAEGVADSIGDTLEGHLALLWRFAAPELALLLGATMLLSGTLLQLLRWQPHLGLLLGPLLAPIARGLEASGRAWRPESVDPLDRLVAAGFELLPATVAVQARILPIEEFVRTALLVALLSGSCALLWGTGRYWYRRRQRRRAAKAVSAGA